MAQRTGRAVGGPGGTYLILCHMEQPAAVQVGRLGEVVFPPGWYVYVGSAQGPGGMAARVARHLRAEKRVHWHIDHLLAWARVEEAWGGLGTERLECRWAQALGKHPGAHVWPAGFGASDCRCPGHLLYFAHRPDPAAFSALRACRLSF